MASIVSRSPVQFLRRSGLLPTPRGVEPVMDASNFPVNRMPLTRDRLDPALLLQAAGDPPSDRGIADLWPPPQEALDAGPNTSEGAT